MESHKTPWFQTTNQPLKSPLNHHTSGSLGKLDVFIPQAPHVHGKANVHQNSAFFFGDAKCQPPIGHGDQMVPSGKHTKSY